MCHVQVWTHRVAEVIMYFLRQKNSKLFINPSMKLKEHRLAAKHWKMGCDPLVWLGQRIGFHSFNPLSPSELMLIHVLTTHVIDISSPSPSSSNPRRSENLRQVLKCSNASMNDCEIFASEWCNSKAMIESKTITMKQFSMPHTFHIFSDILYLVCGEDCQDTWVMGLLSTGNISHSEEWAGEEIWKKQFVINRLCLLHH